MRYNRQKVENILKNPTVIAIAVILIFVGVLVYEFILKDMLATSTLPEGVMYAQFIDVGQGDSTLITAPSGELLLIDTGPAASESALIRYLTDADVKTIDYMVLTHAHEDHIGGAVAVLENFEVKSVIMPDATTNTKVFRETLEAMNREGCDTILAKPKNTYSFGDCSFTVLGPLDTKDKDLNNTSVVLKVEYGSTSMLFTGDMEKSYEKELMEEYGDILDCDILKVGHHGSDTSSGKDFLKTLTPDIAVISSKTGNDYGHPHREVLDRLKELKIEYHRTDKEGDIIIASDGKSEWLYEE